MRATPVRVHIVYNAPGGLCCSYCGPIGTSADEHGAHMLRADSTHMQHGSAPVLGAYTEVVSRT